MRRTFGSIRKLPSGRYQARFTVADAGSFTAPVTFTTKRDADAWLAAEQTKLSTGVWRPPRAAHAEHIERVSTTLGDYAPRALERRKLSARTKFLYDSMLDKFILPKFGKSGLDEITPELVSNWHGSMKKTPSQQQLAYVLLKSILNDAFNDELIARNPCRVRRAAAKKKTEQEVLSVEEFTTFVEAIPEKYRMLFKIAFWCGLRSGEVRALRRSDINLSRGVVIVRHALVKVDGKTLTEAPKTAAGNRTIQLPPNLLKELKPWLIKRGEGLLFTNPGGTELTSQHLSKLHAKGREAIKKPTLTFHGLRHSAATLFAQQGATSKELMDRFGWNTSSMATHYTHSQEQRQRELAERLSALM